MNDNYEMPTWTKSSRVSDAMDFFKDLMASPAFICSLGILAWGTFISVDGYHKYNYEYPAAYQAWVKQTDNPKHLTYDEWKVLIKITKDCDSSYIIPIIVPM